MRTRIKDPCTHGENRKPRLSMLFDDIEPLPKCITWLLPDATGQGCKYDPNRSQKSRKVQLNHGRHALFSLHRLHRVLAN